MEQTNLIVINGNSFPLSRGRRFWRWPGGTTSTSRPCATSRGPRPPAPAGSAWWRSRAPGPCCRLRHTGRRQHGGADRIARGGRLAQTDPSAAALLGQSQLRRARSDGQDWTHFQLEVQKDDGSDELCPVWGDCRLQDLAYRYQVSGEGFQRTPCPLSHGNGQPVHRAGFFPLHPVRPLRPGLQ